MLMNCHKQPFRRVQKTTTKLKRPAMYNIRLGELNHGPTPSSMLATYLEKRKNFLQMMLDAAFTGIERMNPRSGEIHFSQRDHARYNHSI